jgi:hypothetical protein
LTQAENPAAVLKKDLTALGKAIQALEKRLDKLIAALESGEQHEFTGKSNPKSVKVNVAKKAAKAAA